MVNRGRGGSKERDVPENKVPLCRGCHLAKTVGTIKTRLKDGVYYWHKADSDLVFRVPVQISERYGCLVACDGAVQLTAGRNSGPDAASTALSQAGEGQVLIGGPLEGQLPPSPVYAGPGPVSTDIGAQPGPALLMNAEAESEGNVSDLSLLSIATPQSREGQPSPRPASAFSLEDWMEQGRCLRDEGLHLRGLTTEWAFRVGEWWNHGENTWPHESSQMMDELGLSYWQITKFASIAARVPPENRLSRDKSELLTVEHYRAVANLSPEKQPEALEMAVEGGMSASGLKLWLAEKAGATAVVVAPESHECPSCGAIHRMRVV